jgi:hypothetical protein
MRGFLDATLGLPAARREPRNAGLCAPEKAALRAPEDAALRDLQNRSTGRPA